MPAADDNIILKGAPEQFLVEHSTSKSRVLALVHQPGRLPVLSAVLTCTDRLIAHRVADILAQIARSGASPAVMKAADVIAQLLPDAPRASYRKAIESIVSLRWPAPVASAVTGGDLLKTYSPSQLLDDTRTPEERDSALRAFNDTFESAGGVAVRVTRTADLQVHDTERLLAHARLSGWEPSEDEEPDDHVLDATLWLTQDVETWPGVDIANDLAEGEYLPKRASNIAGELSAWAKEWYPKLSELFPVNAEHVPKDEDDDVDWILTPRTADALHTALSVLSDDVYDDIEEFGDEPIGENSQCSVLDRLPRLSWRQDSRWRRQFARAADDLSRDIEAGNWPGPRCNAEELCLHLALRDAEAWVQDESEHSRGHQTLQTHRDDYDWDMCSELFFQDHDILMLDDNWNGAIEDPADPVNRALGMGDLRPDNWFTSFDNVEPRDPKRGYRR